MQIQITIGIFFYNPNKVWYKLIFSAKNSCIIFKFVALYIKNSYSYIGVSITKSKNIFVYYIKLRFICQVILLKFPKKQTPRFPWVSYAFLHCHIFIIQFYPTYLCLINSFKNMSSSILIYFIFLLFVLRF